MSDPEYPKSVRVSFHETPHHTESTVLTRDPQQVQQIAQPYPPFTPSEISQKFEALLQNLPELKDQEKVGSSMKLAVLLDQIGCQAAIIPVIKQGFNDLWLPIKSLDLFSELLDPDQRNHFRQAQSQYLSNHFPTNGRDSGPCAHVHLSSAAMDGEDDVPKTLPFRRSLGKGGYGEVLEIAYIGGKQYALKKIWRQRGTANEQRQMKYIGMELSVLRKLRYHHYVSLVSSYSSNNHVGIIMNPVADSNLQHYLSNFSHDATDKAQLATFFGCLASALAHLHTVYRIRHKDIKPTNILVKGDTVLLTDFGTSFDCADAGHTTTQTEKVRSYAYCAPEVARDEKRNYLSDIWPLGCVFLEMAAVLLGVDLAFLKDSLEEDNQTVSYCRSPNGVKKILEKLRHAASKAESDPLDWVIQMLQDEKKDRPRSIDLRQTIIGARDGRYCGNCCKTATPGMSLQRRPAMLYHRGIEDFKEIEAMEDPGSSENWISQSTARDFCLQQSQLEESSVGSWEGEFDAVRMAEVTWAWNDISGTNKKTNHDNFLIVDQEVNFRMKVGSLALDKWES